MRYSLIGMLAAYLVPTALATGTLLLDIQKTRDIGVDQQTKRHKSLTGRASTVNVELANDLANFWYTAKITIGTPPQSFVVQVDTGSSDTWVPWKNASLCTAAGNACKGGTFDPTASSTFSDIEPGGFEITYVDGQKSSGDYFQDAMTIGDASLKGLEMAVATTTTRGYGILGIGYESNEANIQTGNGTQYVNLVEALVDSGAIASYAFSLWLDDLHASTGSILFGGIDTAKYTGALTKVDVYKTPNRQEKVITEFLVALTSLSITSSSGTDTLTPANYVLAVVLDSGASFTILPNDIASLIFLEVGATYNATLGVATLPCAVGNKAGSINYGFGGPGGVSISVAMSELVFPVTLRTGGTLLDASGNAVCTIGVQPQLTRTTLLFGDTFLRSAYVVYDLYNDEIAMAPTNFNITASNVVAFASVGATIPSATRATGQAAVQSATATTVPTGIALTAQAGFKSAAGQKFEGSWMVLGLSMALMVAGVVW